MPVAPGSNSSPSALSEEAPSVLGISSPAPWCSLARTSHSLKACIQVESWQKIPGCSMRTATWDKSVTFCYDGGETEVRVFP